MSECFGLHPWHLNRLTYPELLEYIDRLPEALARRTFELKLG